jgi:hypothetical protein
MRLMKEDRPRWTRCPCAVNVSRGEGATEALTPFFLAWDPLHGALRCGMRLAFSPGMAWFTPKIDTRRGGESMPLILWLLGVPLSLVLILWLFGVV